MRRQRDEHVQIEMNAYADGRLNVRVNGKMDRNQVYFKRDSQRIPSLRKKQRLGANDRKDATEKYVQTCSSRSLIR